MLGADSVSTSSAYEESVLWFVSFQGNVTFDQSLAHMDEHIDLIKPSHPICFKIYVHKSKILENPFNLILS
ncbi:MAG: hypothetical protein P1U56_22705 [Saprospiraceae bacterium]|nr:hypothetical protein [Saprospiraceae bacterium]